MQFPFQEIVVSNFDRMDKKRTLSFDLFDPSTPSIIYWKFFFFSFRQFGKKVKFGNSKKNWLDDLQIKKNSTKYNLKLVRVPKVFICLQKEKKHSQDIPYSSLDLDTWSFRKQSDSAVQSLDMSSRMRKIYRVPKLCVLKKTTPFPLYVLIGHGVMRKRSPRQIAATISKKSSQKLYTFCSHCSLFI